MALSNRWLFLRWGLGLLVVLLLRGVVGDWLASAFSVALVVAAGFTAQAESRRAAATPVGGGFSW